MLGQFLQGLSATYVGESADLGHEVDSHGDPATGHVGDLPAGESVEQLLHGQGHGCAPAISDESGCDMRSCV